MYFLQVAKLRWYCSTKGVVGQISVRIKVLLDKSQKLDKCFASARTLRNEH